MSDAIVAGTSYQFKVAAANKWGTGIFSEVVTVLAASIPATIDQAPVTSVEASNGDVLITWNEPDDHGAALESYLLQIKNQLGSWQSPTCREEVSEVFANRSCHVPMLSLSAAPFEIGFNELIEVRVSSINSQGQSLPSDINTDGARIRALPG